MFISSASKTKVINLALDDDFVPEVEKVKKIDECVSSDEFAPALPDIKKEKRLIKDQTEHWNNVEIKAISEMMMATVVLLLMQIEDPTDLPQPIKDLVDSSDESNSEPITHVTDGSSIMSGGEWVWRSGKWDFIAEKNRMGRMVPVVTKALVIRS
ncbi:hypothetical protein Bca52824_022365 [Brassica carinata]|uniref:Uncharacterized protein n=1 Tax=Brassica carinata TaxID=52824 RepID=A0A8X8AT94_BRACI|nr:hypothetical protein Bca52824_022365 [Brassica carinata]